MSDKDYMREYMRRRAKRPDIVARRELQHRAAVGVKLLREDSQLEPADVLAAVVWGEGAPKVPRVKAA